MSCFWVEFFVTSSPMLSPSRRTTIRSVISNTSSSLCEMKMTEMPLDLSSVMTLKSLVTSRSLREEVGSSMMRRLAFVRRAFAISIICCWAVLRFLTSVSMLTETSRYLKTSAAFSCIILRSRKGEFFLSNSRPRKRLSRGFRFGQLLSSWKMIEIPAAWACRVVVKDTCFPPQVTVPESGWYTPVRIFIRVDFPAPFSPMRPTTSPGLTSKSTSWRARTPGNDFVMPFITRVLFSMLDPSTSSGNGRVRPRVR